MTTTYQSPTYTPVEAGDIRRMAGVNDAMLLIGRVVLVVMFIFSGAGKFMDLSGTAAEIASKGLPAPMLLASLAGAAEILGGLMIVAGGRPGLPRSACWFARWSPLISSTTSGPCRKAPNA